MGAITEGRRPFLALRRATIPQARMLMRCWLNDDRPIPHVLGHNSTFDVGIRHGWLADTGERYTFPNGQVAPTYRVTKAGLAAAAQALLALSQS